MGIGVLAPGWSQQTMAARVAVSKASGARGGRRTQRRRKKKAAASGATKRKRRSSKKPARLVKGSKAARAYMAQIRRKRK